MRDFRNRWHISLSQYMRDVCFSPFSKYFARLFGPNNTNHAVAVTITFCYFAATLFFFANTPAEIKEILSVMK